MWVRFWSSQYFRLQKTPGTKKPKKTWTVAWSVDPLLRLHSFVVHSGSLNFRALLSDLLLLVCLLWHQLTKQLPFPRDNLRRQQWWEIFQSNIWIYLWHLRKKVYTYVIEKDPGWKDSYLWKIWDRIYHANCDEFVF